MTRVDDLSVCGQFDRLLSCSFPSAYEIRREIVESTSEADMHDAEGVELSRRTPEKLPLFALDAAVPRQHLQLNVFEPRYVRMVRHALEGSRTFGMVGIGRGGELAKQGVEVGIISLAERWDGCFRIEIVGQRPFRILDSSVAEDGLIEADVEYFDVEDGGDGSDEAVFAAAELMPIVQDWEALVRRGGWERLPGHLAMVHEQLGPAPPCDRPGALAAWVVALVNPLPGLGVAPEIRPSFLAAGSPLDRVRVASDGLHESLRNLQAAERSWAVWLCRFLPMPLRKFVPVVIVAGIAVILARMSE